MKMHILSWLKQIFLAEGGRRVLASLMALFVLVWLLLTLPQSGITDDDDFYAPAGISYVAQLGRMISFQQGAWSQSSIDRAFRLNSEHPPLAKYVMGLTHAIFYQLTGLMSELNAARVGVVLLAALLAYLLASFVFTWRGPLAAAVAVLALFSTPRFFFHSQVATLDVAVASLYFLTAYAFWRSRQSWLWAILSGFVFGLALLTKLNAPFAVIPIVAFVLLERWRDFSIHSDATGHKRGLRLPRIPLSLLSMLLVGPLVFVALWPHLWFDTFKRIGAYIAFHLHHYAIYLYYLGRIFNKPFAPWHTPFVQFWITTPLVLLAAMFAGLLSLRGLLTFMRRGHEPDVLDAEKLSSLSDSESEHRRRYEEGASAFYLLAHLFVTIGIVAFLGAPKYGGVKLFLPFFPFVAALVGAGVDASIRAILALWPRLQTLPIPLAPLLAALVMLPAVIATSTSHPFGLSYFGAGIGGLRGATALGFERQYYDVADKELAAWFNAHAERGATVFFAPNNKEYRKTWRWLHRDKYLRADLRQVRSRSQAQYLVLYHERRWSTYPALAEDMLGKQALYTKKIDGVPLYSVYKIK